VADKNAGSGDHHHDIKAEHATDPSPVDLAVGWDKAFDDAAHGLLLGKRMRRI
jgi:hypothetical protein